MLWRNRSWKEESIDGKLHCSPILRNCHRHPSLWQPHGDQPAATDVSGLPAHHGPTASSPAAPATTRLCPQQAVRPESPKFHLILYTFSCDNINSDFTRCCLKTSSFNYYIEPYAIAIFVSESQVWAISFGIINLILSYFCIISISANSLKNLWETKQGINLNTNISHCVYWTF